MAPPPVDQKGQSSKAVEKTFDLVQLDDVLLFNNEEEASTHVPFTHGFSSTRPQKYALRLKDPQRRIIHQGSLGCNSKQKEYLVFLLDHVLVITEPRPVGGRERLRVIHHPIPVTLLQVSFSQSRLTIFGRISLPLGQTRYQLHFSSLGKQFNDNRDLTLLAPTADAANTWIESVNSQREVNQQRPESNVLQLGEDVVKGHGEIKINCAALYSNNQNIVYGTDDGVYLQPQNGQSRKAIDWEDVQQIEVLEDLSLLFVLAVRSAFVFPLNALETEDPMKYLKRIASHTSFIKTGRCLDRTMVCIAKTSSLSTTVKTLEVNESSLGPDSNRGGRTSLDENMLKDFKEFYMATEAYSIQFLKTKVCVAAASGFEIVDIETLDTQHLIDTRDQKLEFVWKGIEPRPLSMYRIGGEFLLCYREFAFYIERSGMKSEKDVIIHWEGTPTVCALHYPYLVGFSPNFVEIRHVDDGALVQVIHERGLRRLHAKGAPSEDLAYHISRQRENSILVSTGNRAMFLTPNSSQMN